jgi:hypothetical protein
MWHVLVLSIPLVAQLPGGDVNMAEPQAVAVPPTQSVTSPDLWRVETVQVAGGEKEIRVLRADGSVVTVGEGLADMGQRPRLIERARNKANKERQVETIVGRALALGTAGVITGGSALLTAVGLGFWAWNSQGVPSDLDKKVASLVKAGQIITVVGFLGTIVGFCAVVASAGFWAWLYFKPQPEPPASAVDALAGAKKWCAKEANEVVTAHNARR